MSRQEDIRKENNTGESGSEGTMQNGYPAGPTIQYITTNAPAKEPHYLGAWSYFWLEVLYAIPVIGWIILIIHACMSSHENRCHFARSFFCWLLFPLIAGLITLAVTLIVVLASGAAIHGIGDFFGGFGKMIGDFFESLKEAVANGHGAFYYFEIR